MYWLASLKCRECEYEEADKQIDAETEEAAKVMSFDCPNCGGPGTLQVLGSTLRTRFVV